MNDDRIQGILFTKQDYLDLSEQTGREGIIKTLRRRSHLVKSWRNRLARNRLPHSEYIVVRKGRSQPAQTEELLNRLKLR